MTEDVTIQSIQAYTEATEAFKRLQRRQDRQRRKALENISTLSIDALMHVDRVEDAKKIYHTAPVYSDAEKFAKQKVCEIYEKMLDAADSIELLQNLQQEYSTYFRVPQYVRSDELNLLNKVFGRNLERLIDLLLGAAVSLAEVYAVWNQVWRYNYGEAACAHCAHKLLPKRVSMKRFRLLCADEKADHWLINKFYRHIFEI